MKMPLVHLAALLGLALAGPQSPASVLTKRSAAYCDGLAPVVDGSPGPVDAKNDCLDLAKKFAKDHLEVGPLKKDQPKTIGCSKTCKVAMQDNLADGATYLADDMVKHVEEILKGCNRNGKVMGWKEDGTWITSIGSPYEC